MNLADNLKKIRKENNLSQEQLAEKLGVSRQSVSKWESNQAYPEMDKMLQICQLFNLNIDDLLNQDIKEVNNNKQSKNNINKFIDDFLDYVTKTINMFSSMKFKEKIKCIFEQLIIISVMLIIFLIIGSIGSNILVNILIILPDTLYYIIYNLFESIYIIFTLILGLVLLFHIFKVRYLDYYEFVNDESDLSKLEIKEELKDEKFKEITKEKIKVEKSPEKIIIRDPKHSSYKFISGLLRCLLFMLKLVVFLIAICFCLTLIVLVISFIIDFLIIKTGLLFIGSLITIISLIIINFIVLILLYNFIISKKNKKSKLFTSFLISLVLFGSGIGIISIDILNFDYIDNINDINYCEEFEIITMEEDMLFEDYYGVIEYVEENRNDIKIVYKHSKYYDIIRNNEGKITYFYHTINIDNLEFFKVFLNDFNDSKLIDYSRYKIIIYTSKENILKLKQNKQDYYINYNLEIENRNNLENKIYDLERELEIKEDEINKKEEIINDLKLQIQEFKNK